MLTLKFPGHIKNGEAPKKRLFGMILPIHGILVASSVFRHVVTIYEVQTLCIVLPSGYLT